MLRHISLGPAAIQTAPLIFIVGFFLLTEISRRRAHKHDAAENTITNALTFALLGGLLIARIAYVITHWSAYENRLEESLALSLQGLTHEVGLIAGWLFYLGYVRWRGIRWPTALDILAPGLGVFMVLLPLGFLANGDVIGQPSDVPWAIDLWNETRHPVQVYAALGSMLTLLLWAQAPRLFSGAEMLTILVGTAITWLLVGFLLAEPWLLANYRGVQVLGWATLIASAFIWSLHEPATS